MKYAVLPAFLLVLLLQADLRAQGPANRAEALRTLKGCSTRPVTLNCNEDTAGYLIELYKHGDRSLLRPLLDAGRHSDGALSESLGDFYSSVLTTRPRSFLSALSLRPRKQQSHLCWMAGETDGSGMSASTLRKVRRSLRSFSSDKNLAPVARICLSEVNRVNAGR
jgi:hypothetical protein